MIKCNLPVLLAERGLKITKVSKDTGISRTTLTSLNTDSSQGIQFDTLNKLCNYLKITPGKLFIYIPFDIELSNFSKEKFDDEQGNVYFTLKINTDNNYKTECDFDAEIDIMGNQINITYNLVQYLSEEMQGIQEKNFRIIRNFFNQTPIQFLKDIDRKIQEWICSNYFEDGENNYFSFDWNKILEL